ncbi:MAG: hypothetical protein HN380_01755 [Victivallales bacterium]|nr:hypothetical protein [Victivallales bacterium]
MCSRYKTSVFLGGLAMACAALSAQKPEWPNRQWLLKSLVKGVPGILAKQDAETGRFGSEPWICSDQNVLFPLAAAWSIESPNNPFHHDPKLLAAICRGGEALVEAQDKDGKWTFRKKDNSTWGQIHMPWTYSRWIRAYLLVRDAMPAASRKTWERGLLLGFKGIRKYADGHVHNIPTHHAMALYFAGLAFENQDWQDAARAFMAKTVALQDPNGFWSEHYGPVVGYNRVYMDALGTYYAVSGDQTVLAALERSARFHAMFLWPDGSAVVTVDERQIHHGKRDIGNVGFSHTAVGRGYLLGQTAAYRDQDRAVSAEYAAFMLLYSGTGPSVPLAATLDRSAQVLGDGKAGMLRRKPWQVCVSAYACDPINNRWIQDRQNFVGVYHDQLGLVVGGGNTKLQPYWSTFTVGDPTLLKHTPGNTKPDFIPKVDLLWTPQQAELRQDENTTGAVLHYGETSGQVTAEPGVDGALALVYRVEGLPDAPVEAHVPFLKRRGRLRFANGQSLYLGEKPVRIEASDTGGAFTWRGLRATIPEGSHLLWPALQHNPYTKDGHSPLKNAKLVLCLPFSAERKQYEIAISEDRPPAFDGIVHAALDLPVVSPTGTRMKRLDGLGSHFLAAAKNGDAMVFTLPVKKEGTYELLADFVTYPGYGIFQLSVDGKPLGQPFDGYTPELDESEPVSFGQTQLAAGPHQIELRLVGKNPKASRSSFLSVRRFFLLPKVP